MTQKLIQIGNSTGMTLSSDFVQNTNFQPGTSISVDYNVEDESFTVRKVKPTKKTVLQTPELSEWLTKFNKKYKKGLTELANK